MPFTFDTARGRYRDAGTGRLVSEGRVRLAVDAVADHASDRMADLTAQLVRGEVTLERWQAGMMALTKQSHVAAGVVAAGGRAQMTPAAYGFLGSELRAQYGYLTSFAAAIAAERVSIDGRLVARAGMYGQHARATYEAVRRRDQRERGYRFEKNILHSRESCGQCVALSSRGWVEIGSLPPIGSRTCLARCRCTISYRKAPVEVAA
jgi:hypothetical protein